MSIKMPSILAILLLATISTSPTTTWNLVWSDEFDGSSVDQSKWSFENGDGCPNLCGFGNNELQWYQSENTHVSDGKLIIEAKRQNAGNGHQYTSSKLLTKGKGDWKFGRIEISARLPKGRGIWPAIWMLPTDNLYGMWPRSGNINIVELVGQQPSTAYMIAHYGELWNNKGQKGTSYTLPNGETFNEKFHKFSIEWKENEIKWFLDDVHKLTLTKDEVTADRGFLYPFNERFHLILNIAVGGNWPGSPDSSTQFPQKMEIDYVRVYQ